jgi:phage terminase large subunit-like protein
VPRGKCKQIVPEWGERAARPLCALAFCWRTCAALRRGTNRTASFTQLRKAATRRPLSFRWRRRYPVLARAVTIQETAKSLICSELGTRYRALSADATTAYGLSPQLVIHDELGLVRGPRSPLFEALETATGAQENPISIIISTQAATDADLLSVLDWMG